MTGWKLAVAALSLGGLAAPAIGQGLGIDGINFVRAVQERETGKAVELLKTGGPTIIDAKDSKGTTALLAAVGNRDDALVGYLLNQGANPNLSDHRGETPLLAAARIGFDDAVRWLIAAGAKVDGANRSGETPLIVAVQQRRARTVSLLLERGANPDETDNAAGYSARDYAKRDTRNRELLKLIEAKSPTPKP